MNIGKGGALNKGLKLIKQLIRVFRCILETHIRLRLKRCSADLCQAMVALQLRSSFYASYRVAPEF